MVKRKSQKSENESFPDDFLRWLASPKGRISEQAIFAVTDSLEGCSVDPDERVIVWNDGKRLSIPETARRIHELSKLPLTNIESAVVGWLEMDYVPHGFSEQQMERFESLIEDWIRDHESSHPEYLNSP
jgi:hypothetical protein